LSLESRDLKGNVEKARATEVAWAQPDVIHCRLETSLAIPYRFPRQGFKVPELNRRGAGKAGLVPQFAEDHAVDEKHTALERARTGSKGQGDGAHRIKKRGPVFLNPRRRPDQIKAKDPKRLLVVVDWHTRSHDPLWCLRGPREIQDDGLVKVDAAVGSATIVDQHLLKYRDISL
jgi:hypothetical protein